MAECPDCGLPAGWVWQPPGVGQQCLRGEQCLHRTIARLKAKLAQAMAVVEAAKHLRSKGVCWKKRDAHWEASIRVPNPVGGRGRLRHLGCYRDPEKAARAYDAAAVEVFGEFAVLNFPPALPKEG